MSFHGPYRCDVVASVLGYVVLPGLVYDFQAVVDVRYLSGRAVRPCFCFVLFFTDVSGVAVGGLVRAWVPGQFHNIICDADGADEFGVELRFLAFRIFEDF